MALMIITFIFYLSMVLIGFLLDVGDSFAMAVSLGILVFGLLCDIYIDKSEERDDEKN